MNTELKQLIEDAAKLLGLGQMYWSGGITIPSFLIVEHSPDNRFNPADPERGDLMKLMEAAELVIDMREGLIYYYTNSKGFNAKTFFTKGDYQSLAYAVLRAASAVLKARGE